MSSELDRFARSHRCPTCKDDSSLVVYWDRQTSTEKVRCGRCRATEGFERRKSTTQLWRENPGNVDIATANRLSDKYADEINEVVEGLPPELRPAFERGRK